MKSPQQHWKSRTRQSKAAFVNQEVNQIMKTDAWKGARRLNGN